MFSGRAIFTFPTVSHAGHVNLAGKKAVTVHAKSRPVHSYIPTGNVFVQF